MDNNLPTQRKLFEFIDTTMKADTVSAYKPALEPVTRKKPTQEEQHQFIRTSGLFYKCVEFLYEKGELVTDENGKPRESGKITWVLKTHYHNAGWNLRILQDDPLKGFYEE